MKKSILAVCALFFFEIGANATLPNDPQDQIPFIMANCFAQIVVHGLTAAQAGNNKELRVHELSKAIHCFAQFLVQFFNTPKRSFCDDSFSIDALEQCLNDASFMDKFDEDFFQELQVIFDAMQAPVDVQALTSSLHFDR